MKYLIYLESKNLDPLVKKAMVFSHLQLALKLCQICFFPLQPHKTCQIQCRRVNLKPHPLILAFEANFYFMSSYF